MRTQLLFFTTLFIFSACNEDRFIQELEVELPDVDSQLAVTATLSAADTTLSVFVSRTVSSLAPADADAPVADATIRLTRDGESLGDFALAPQDQPDKNGRSGDYRLANAAGLLVPGTTYQLEVSAPGFAPTMGSQILPDTASIGEASVTPEGYIDTDGSRLDELAFTLNDLVGERSYYRLSVSILFEEPFENELGEPDTIRYKQKTYPLTNDPTIQEGWVEGLYFTDGAFQDRSTVIRLGLYRPRFFGNDAIRFLGYVIQLDNLTQDYYNYERSVDAYQRARDNPFAEPVNIVGNLDGGPGIFGLSGRVERLVPAE